MNLNLNDQHLSYIVKFYTYASKYQCRTCHRHFLRLNNMQRHQRNCKGQTTKIVSGRILYAPKTIFDKLEEKYRLFKRFLVYDFEAILLPVRGEGSEKLAWTSKHVLFSVSISSNVDGFTSPNFIIDPVIDSLVNTMVNYMRISQGKEENWLNKSSTQYSKSWIY